MANSPGYAILIQGDNSGTYRENYAASLDDIYKKLRNRSFPAENIYYLGYQGAGHDPGITINAVSTKANVQYAIANWAATRIATGGIAPLYIIMMDHGSKGLFHIDPATITPEELDGWITTLETAIQTSLHKNLNTVVIDGSCYSGSFIPKLSKQGRVIVTSGAEDEETAQGPITDTKTYGEYFVYYLFSNLAAGDNLRDAFKDAAQVTHKYRECKGNDCKTNSVLGNQGNTRQHPLLDDNGDGKGSWMGVVGQEDGAMTSRLILGTGTNPVTIAITEVMPTAKVMQGAASVTAWARTSDPAKTLSSWVEVKKPSYAAPDAGGTGQVIMDLPKFTYSRQASGRWEYDIPLLDVRLAGEPGLYTLYYYAMDDNGDILPPVAGTLYVDTVANNPPASFNLTSPADNAEVNDAMMIFRWEKAVDPDHDPVTYTIKIYDEETRNEIKRYELIPQDFFFMNAALEKRSDGVTPLFTTGKYYLWKVEAIDDKGKSSETPARRFHVIFTNAQTGILTGIIYSDRDYAKIVSATITATIGGFTLNIPVTDGTYVVAVTPGTFDLSGVSSGYQNAVVTDVTVRAGEATMVNIMMTPSGPMGDLDGSGTVDIADAILALRVISGSGAPDGVTIHTGNSVASGRIGMEDVIYIIQHAAGLR